MQDITYNRWAEEQQVREAYRLSDQNSRNLLSVFLIDDQDEIKRLLAQCAADSKRISELVRAIEPQLDTEEEKRLLNAVEAARQPYIESYKQALAKLLDEHQREEARKMMVEVSLPRIAVYHAAWDAFAQCQVDKIEQGIRLSKADFASAQQRLLFLIILAVLITSVTAVYVTVNVSREVAERQRAQEALRQSYGQLEQRIQQRTTELAQTNQALQTEVVKHMQAAEELRWKTAFLEAQVNSSIDGILVVDPNRKTALQNQRFIDLFKIPRHIADGETDENRLQWVAETIKNPEPFIQKVLHLYAHPNEISHDEIELKDGTTLDRHSFSAIGKDGKYYGRVWTFRDITERKRFEAQLIQAQRLETVGKLAGGVAHEFNSILTAIIGQSELILGDLPSDSPLSKNVTEIHRAADRAATLTRQLLAYGRKQILQPETIDLNVVLAGMESTLQHLLGRDVDVRIVPGAGLKAVKIDPGQIEQVIVNLAMNAAAVMPNGGKFTLETANATLDSEYVSHFEGLKAGEYVMLAMTDTGTGISPEVKKNLFEPFFTTKGVGQGPGLGLATCYGILKQSGGHINVYSELSRGATFKIYLPQAGARSKIPALPPTVAPLPRGTETILLVEDDPSLREMASTLLTRLGYTVLTAADGLQALNVKHQRGVGHVDMVFTDVVMPHMSGKELADRFQVLYPQTKILFTSAYTENAIVHQGVLNSGVILLQKPFTPTALAVKVREVLDGDKLDLHKNKNESILL
jgi:signal transduction histidine kinase/ActR/RegA family two-component response regulator